MIQPCCATQHSTIFQYTHGVRDRTRVSPDAWTVDQHFLDRPGNDAIQLALLQDYPANLALYAAWHAYFRERQPRTLIVWGQHDPFFTVAGAQAYRRDLPEAELHLLDTGHFALEEDHDAIATHIRRFIVGQPTDDDAVLIDDRFRVGTAELVVTQPRLPCYKLGIRFGRPDMVRRFLKSGRTGFYLAVEREGEVAAGDPIIPIQRTDHGVTMADITRLYARERGDLDNLRRVVALKALPASWRDYFRRQIDEQARSGG